MRLSVLCVALAIAAAFLLGRATNLGNASATTSRHVYTGGQGDVFRVPAAATRCVVSQEGGFPNLVCDRIPRGRYTVVFYKDSFLVWRIGKEDPVFSARWQP